MSYAPDVTDEFDRSAYVTTAEAASAIGVSRMTIRRWVAAGHVRGVRTLGGHLLVERASLADAVPRPVRTAPESALSASQSDEQPAAVPVRPCACPRDPDDEHDPGSAISTCPVHGWD